jgi:2-oxoglutarate ferredoxin oxidoreductase subunit beta
LVVKHGEPLLFGTDNQKGLRLNPQKMALEVVTLGDGVSVEDVLVHDETNPTLGYMLARMPFPEFPVALGVLHKKQRPTYHQALTEQRNVALERFGKGDLASLLNSGNTWEI